MQIEVIYAGIVLAMIKLTGGQKDVNADFVHCTNETVKFGLDKCENEREIFTVIESRTNTTTTKSYKKLCGALTDFINCFLPTINHCPTEDTIIRKIFNPYTLPPFRCTLPVYQGDDPAANSIHLSRDIVKVHTLSPPKKTTPHSSHDGTQHQPKATENEEIGTHDHNGDHHHTDNSSDHLQPPIYLLLMAAYIYYVMLTL